MTATLSLPVRAPDVTLVGQLPDAAFQERQWLVRRDQQFVQLTELLYRIVEHADGNSTHEEIAARVTEASEWQVTPADIELLLRTRLEPAGLVASGRHGTTHGAARDRGGSNAGVRATSPLAVQMRMKVIGPRIIEPVSRLLQHLFAPVVLVPLGVLSAIAHIWAYAANDIGDAVGATLYTPGGLLFALGILIGGALFHELGHAAALRYGGGVVRGIGVGLYLIFPAFFTDVTDAYRLGRSARVRTDLGGVYFHFLFAAALIVIAGATGNPLLLFAAVLIDIEMARQFIPFVRLDGYWLLADITGVPDLLSQAGPFLRSIARRRRPAAPALPPLRPWARATFLVYIALTVPVLVYLFVLMLVNAPRLFIAARDAFIANAAYVQGNETLWVTVLAVTQMIIIALPAIGTVLVALSILSLPLSRLVSPISPKSRRVVGRLTYGTASALVIAWLSQGGASSATGAMTEADRVIAETRAAFTGLDSLRADVEGTVGADHFTGTVLLARPNLARIEIRGSEGLGRFDVVSNGSDVFVYFPDNNQFSRMPSGAEGQHISAFVVAQVQHFFDPSTVPRLSPGASLLLESPTDAAESSARVLRVVHPETGRIVRYFISTADSLVHRIVYEGRDSSRSDFVELKNVRTAETLPPATFAWTLPAGATTLDMPMSLDFSGGRTGAR